MISHSNIKIKISETSSLWEDPCYDHHHPETEMADNVRDHIKNMNLALHEVIDWIKQIEYRLSTFTKGPRHLSKEDYIAITCTMDKLEDKEMYKKGKETATDIIPTHPNSPTSLNMSQQPVKTYTTALSHCPIPLPSTNPLLHDMQCMHS